VAPPSSDQSPLPPALLAGSLTTSSSAPLGPESDSVVSGLSLFTATDYPLSEAFIKLLPHHAPDAITASS